MEKLLTPQTILIFAILVLPGFVSLRVYSLIRSVDRISLRENLFDALTYGLVNAGFNAWLIPIFISTTNLFYQFLIAVWVLILAPVIWAILLGKLLVKLEKKGVILGSDRTAWDYFFTKKKPCWIIVHMNHGIMVGGQFADNSFATLHPNSGHLFLENIYAVNQDTGEFVGDEPTSDGMLFRPEDYRFIEIKSYI